MEFRIADTFTESLARLTGEEQKAVKMTAFDLQMNPANPGMQFHKLVRTKDKNFWSVRVSSDLRIIVHRSDSSLLLCYVGHHDDAYDWAARRKIETHPKTGAAQIVEIRESIKEITVPTYVESEQSLPPRQNLFADVSEETLLYYGVPEEWLEDVRNANEETLLEIAEHLPAEAAEALLSLAVGATPEVARKEEVYDDPFDHPDAQRRFRVMNNIEELERALEYPWDKWAIFLHPAQKHLVEANFSGPARISGSAGTGKTIVALHRATYLARENQNARVLLTTFSDPLANALQSKLKLLAFNEPRTMERIEVQSLDGVGERLYELNYGTPNIADKEHAKYLLTEIANQETDNKFSIQFLTAEWEEVVDAWQLSSWEEYRDVMRLGRKTRLAEKQRAILWRIFERLRQCLNDKGMITNAGMFDKLTSLYAHDKSSPFDYIVIDEAQDISVSQLRFLSALKADIPNGLFFTGDLGQRIFQQPFSWKALGVDIRGRSRTLRINYRTSHQIRMQADQLLGTELSDVDGNKETRHGTVSAFNGPLPTILTVDSIEDEKAIISCWLLERIDASVNPHEIGVFVRSQSELPRAQTAIEEAGLAYKCLDERVETKEGHISIITMHLAKGLEFKAVVVMACDDEIVPLQERIETVADVADLEEVYNTERHLLYVACTRARDYLLVTGVEPASEFLDDLL